MATYALTVSTNALGLGVISSATVVVERKRTTVTDIYPTSSLYTKKAATNVSGIATIQLEADDGTVFHEVKIFNTIGVLIYKNTIQMPPQAADIEDLPLNDIISASAYQAVQAKDAAQTSATNAANSAAAAAISATNASNSATAAANSAAAAIQAKNDTDQLKSDTQTLKDQAATSEANSANSESNALNYANIASASARIYTTTAIGLAATTSGQLFLVKTSDITQYNVYSNDSGSASLIGIMSIADGTVLTKSAPAGKAFGISDGYDNYAVFVDNDGAFRFGTGVANNLTVTTLNATTLNGVNTSGLAVAGNVMSTDGSGFNICDPSLNVAFNVANDGTVNAGSIVSNSLSTTTLNATTLNGVNTSGLAVAGSAISTDGSGFNICDQSLNVAFNVANDGTVNAGSIVSNSLSTTTLTATTLNGSSISDMAAMAAAGNIIDPNNTPNGLAYSIYDQNGNAAFGVDNNGGIILSTGTINNANINYINGVNYLSPVGFSAEINHILNYGQSLSVGYLATAVTTSQLYDNLMLNSGKTAFTPLIEPCTPNGLGETPSSVSGNVLKQLILSENGISYSQQSYQLLYTSDGVGAQSIAQLSNGASNYTNMIANIASTYALAQADGKSYNIPAMLWTQGEQDYYIGTSRSAYTAAMENLRSGIEIIAKKYGQTNALEMVCYQTSTHKKYSVSYPSIALAQLDAHKTYNHIHMACPTYHLTYNSGDNVHLTSNSARKLGAHYGVALKRILIDGKQWQPLRPISKYKQGAIAIVKFNVPYGNLVFDTALVAANTNYGFNLFDSGGTEITINSVSIIEKDTIKIVAASTIPSGAKLQYAFYGSGTSGSVDGPRGNLRDTQGTAIIYDPSGLNYPVHNWCVMFEEIF